MLSAHASTMTTANANRFLLLLCCFNDVDDAVDAADADDDDGDTPRVSFAPFIPTAEHIVYIQRNAQQTNERASE